MGECGRLERMQGRYCLPLWGWLADSLADRVTHEQQQETIACMFDMGL